MLLPQCPSQESITVIYIVLLRFSAGLISLDIPKCANTFHYILEKSMIIFDPFVCSRLYF